MKELFKKLPPFARNFYVVTAVLLFVWMLFFDSNDFINQYQNYNRLQELENEKEYYLKKTVEVQEESDALFGTKKQLEKFARESYLMKKNTEDIYVIQREE